MSSIRQCYSVIWFCWLLSVFAPLASAFEPIIPIPQILEYDRAKAELGKRLFLEKGLSSDGQVSCHSCHDFDHGGAEPRSVSIGVSGRKGSLNAPTVFNSFFNFRQFWNGRALDLQEQAAGPLHSPVEMDMSAAVIETFLRERVDYREDFEKAFGSDEISFERVVEAIAEFEKALFTPNSKFDRYLRGELQLSAQEKSGYVLFKTLGCVSCHNGINIGGNSFQYLGAVVPVDTELEGDRFQISGDPFDRNRFKVPTLRNVGLTPPYLHDGSKENLSGVLKVMAYHNLGFDLTDQEIDLLAQFLHTLTGEKPAILE